VSDVAIKAGVTAVTQFRLMMGLEPDVDIAVEEFEFDRSAGFWSFIVSYPSDTVPLRRMHEVRVSEAGDKLLWFGLPGC
jgi:hypothetical protein